MRKGRRSRVSVAHGAGALDAHRHWVQMDAKYVALWGCEEGGGPRDGELELPCPCQRGHVPDGAPYRRYEQGIFEGGWMSVGVHGRAGREHQTEAGVFEVSLNFCVCTWSKVN